LEYWYYIPFLGWEPHLLAFECTESADVPHDTSTGVPGYVAITDPDDGNRLQAHLPNQVGSSDPRILDVPAALGTRASHFLLLRSLKH
jgi:hypothetical protein